MIRRTLTVAGVGLTAAVALAAPALANWGTSGTATGTASAAVLQAPASASAAPTIGSTSSSITISWTAPASGPAPTGYRVDRTGPSGATATGICSVGSAVRTCTDAGRSASTAYTYGVTSLHNNWDSAARPASATTSGAAATTLTITSPAAGATDVPRVTTFSGTTTGIASGSSVTVNVYAGTNTSGTASRTLTDTDVTAGSWSVSLGANNGGSGRLASSAQYTMVVSQTGATSVSRTFTTGTTDSNGSSAPPTL